MTDRLLIGLYLLLYLAVILGPPALLWYMGLPWLAAIILIPLTGWIVSRILVKHTGSAFGWIEALVMNRWQGRYYAFNDVQVRVYEGEDALWFAAGDVLQAVGMKGVPDAYLAVYPDDCRTLEGLRVTVMNPRALEHLLGKRNDHESVRFLQWMRREVVRPWERRQERG